MSNKRPGEQTNPEAASLLPVRPLGGAELVLIQLGISEIAPDWAAELLGICSEEATVVVLPKNGDDAMGASFVISRETYKFRVDQIHWDEMTEVGLFTSLDDVLQTLRVRLAFYVAGGEPTSGTLH
jgi:hypothetical protein